MSDISIPATYDNPAVQAAIHQNADALFAAVFGVTTEEFRSPFKPSKPVDPEPVECDAPCYKDPHVDNLLIDLYHAAVAQSNAHATFGAGSRQYRLTSAEYDRGKKALCEHIELLTQIREAQAGRDSYAEAAEDIKRCYDKAVERAGL